MRPQIKSQFRPLVKMIRRRDRPARARRLSYRDILLESRRALDGGLVGAGVFVDIIRGPVGRKAAFGCHARAGVACVVFHYVVLDQRAGGPTINGERAASAGTVGAGEVDVSILV